MADVDSTTSSTPDPPPFLAADSSQPVSDSSSAPDTGSAYSDVMSSVDPTAGKIIKAVEAEDNPAIKQLTAQDIEQRQRAQQAESRLADLDEHYAKILESREPEINEMMQKMPTREGIYATNAHVMPFLAILSAIGGKTARLSGLDMLSATNGIIQGVNEGNDQKYQDALQKWNAGYQAFQDHLKLQAQTFSMMEKAYAGRVDAQEKAAAATERMLNNVRTEQQRKLTTALGAYHAQQELGVQLANLKVHQEELGIKKQQAGLMSQLAGGPVTGDTPLSQMNPYQVMSELSMAEVPLKGARNVILQEAQAVIASHGDWTKDELIAYARSQKTDMAATLASARTVATNAGRVAQAVVTLNQPGGSFDQLLEAAKKVNFKGNRVAIQSRKWYNEHVKPDDDIADLLAAIHETYGPLSTALSGGGRGATDTTRRWAEEEIPAFTSYDALKRGVDRSRKMVEMANKGDATTLRLLSKGESVDKIYDETVGTGGSAAEPMTNPGYAPKDDKGRELRYNNKTKSYLYVNPTDLSDWVEAGK